MAVWIMFCFFCSIGIVQCLFWTFDAFKKPEKLKYGYHVIPLYNQPDELEAQIRLGLTRLRRAGLDGESVLLVDMGLDEECQKICERLIHGIGGIFICDSGELDEAIRDLDNLQNNLNAVK